MATYVMTGWTPVYDSKSDKNNLCKQMIMSIIEDLQTEEDVPFTYNQILKQLSDNPKYPHHKQLRDTMYHWKALIKSNIISPV